MVQRGPIAQSQSSDVPMASKDPLNSPMFNDGIPGELISYFNLDRTMLDSTSKDHLNDIYKMMKADDKTIGDIVKEIRATENRMGAIAFNETRHERLWNYMTLVNRIKDLEKQKEAMLNVV